MSLRWAPRDEHPWVLLEGDGVDARAAERSLRALGYEVYVCSGPGASRTCPLLRGERCGLVANAEVVVNALGTQDPAGVIASRASSITQGAFLCVGQSEDDDHAAGAVHDPTARVSAEHLARALRVAFDLVGSATTRPSDREPGADE